MVHGYAHAALYTDQFEETISFYERAFGAVSCGQFMTDVRGVWLKIGDSILEIFESEKLPSEGAFKHIALSCDSVDTLYAHAIKEGATEHVAPKDVCLEMDVPQKLRIAFVKGINGEQIELCEERL